MQEKIEYQLDLFHMMVPENQEIDKEFKVYILDELQKIRNSQNRQRRKLFKELSDLQELCDQLEEKYTKLLLKDGNHEGLKLQKT